ncbi:MAG TPA: transglutaminase family protein [Planctomycetaceae bacterium]|nr:transglutaminase family protein [Planctomycetaceae bacterium]
MKSFSTRCCLAFVCCLPFPCSGAEEKLPVPQREETWQAIFLSGQRVGYARVLVDPREVDGQPVVHTSAETQMVIRRFGQTLKMNTSLASEETLDGDLLEFRFKMANPPASSSSTTGTVKGKELQLESTVDNRVKKSTAPWKEGVKSPTFQDRLLRINPLKPGETKTFDAFFPEFSKPGTLTVTAGGMETITLLDGESKSLQKMKVANSLLPGIVTNAWVDATGQTVKSSTNMLGTEMVTWTVSKEDAMKALTVADLDLGVSTLVKTAKIDRPYETKKVVYKITIKEDNPAKVLPTGDTQSVKSTGPETAELTVVALPIPNESAREDVGEEYLKPSRFLQSDDERVQEHSRLAAGDLTDAAQIARAMEKYVRDKLTKKDFSTALASAGEVARNLQGDCTEHAVLLAAMLRAKKIPSRIAVGLVYVDSLQALGGHMWTEARLGGKWVPLDGTLGRGGIGATHIKLADITFADDDTIAPLSSFAPLMTVLGKLEIGVVSAE